MRPLPAILRDVLAVLGKPVDDSGHLRALSTLLWTCEADLGRSDRDVSGLSFVARVKSEVRRADLRRTRDAAAGRCGYGPGACDVRAIAQGALLISSAERGETSVAAGVAGSLVAGSLAPQMQALVP